MTKHERWAPIPGHAPYEASDHGRIRNTRTGNTLKPARRAGYPSVALALPSGIKYEYVHRLVLRTFVGGPEEGQIALHWDGDPDNNHVTNLRWGTTSDNALDSVRHGTHHQAAKTHCKWGHALEPWNLYPNPRQRQCQACKSAREYATMTKTPLTPELRDRFYHPPRVA